METLEFQADLRQETGKNASKQLRKSGRVPAVIYGEHSDPIHLVLNSREIGRFYRTHRRSNVLIKLCISGPGQTQEVTVLPKEFSKDAISQDIIHVDFVKIDPTHPIRTEISLDFEGIPPGVKKGGNLMHKIRQVKIRSLPADVPSSIKIDLSNLEVGESIRVRDIDTAGKFELLSAADEIIVYVEAVKGQEVVDPAAAQA